MKKVWQVSSSFYTHAYLVVNSLRNKHVQQGISLEISMFSKESL